MDKIPDFFYNMLIKQYGQQITNKIIEGYSKSRKTTLRINTMKATIDEIKNILSSEKIEYNEVDWLKEALIIENADEKRIRELNIYDEGKIYLQSLSSMLPVVILNPQENENILDMAAAPGGKTTQICAMSKGQALVTACERNKIRYERLKYNIQKQGANRVNVLLKDARDLDDYFSFDKILLDAPCSGSGTLYLLDENIGKYFTKELIQKSQKTQMQLLKKAIKILKSGHEIVYSTCSILKEENENNLIQLLKDKNVEIIPINKEKFKNVPTLPTSIDGTLCILPNELYEGFFVAKLRKI